MSRPVWIPTMATFLVSALVCSFIIFLAERERVVHAQNAAQQLGALHARNVGQNLTQSLSAALALAALVHRDGSIHDFDRLAADIIQHYGGGISSLQLAPGGVVQQVHPLEGNERAVGHDLLKDPKLRMEALGAVRTRNMVLAGPFELIPGGTAVIGHYPLFLPGDTDEEESFWGFTVVLIRLPRFLESIGLDDLKKAGYDYALSRIHPETGKVHVFARSDSLPAPEGIPVQISVPSGEWTLSLAPEGGWKVGNQILPQGILGLFVSVVVTAIGYRLARSRMEIRNSNQALQSEIGQRMEIDAHLLEEKERAQSYLQVAGTMIVALDLSGRVTLVNHKGCDVLGLREEEIIGQTWFERFIPDSQQARVRAVFARIMEGDLQPHEYVESVLVRGDGEMRHMAWHNALLRDARGCITGTLSSGEDITERLNTRRLKDEALDKAQRSRNEAAVLLEGARLVLASSGFEEAARSIFNLAKQISEARGGYVALLSGNGEENELLFLDSGGLPCTVNPDLPMPVRGLRAEAYRGGKPVFENRFALSPWASFLPEGHVLLKNVLFAPLLVSGKVVGLIGLSNKPEDFTEDDARIVGGLGEFAAMALMNARNRQSLVESEERFRSLVETAQDAVVTIDEAGRMVFCNQAAGHIFGYQAREMVGRPVTMLMPASVQERHRESMMLALERSSPAPPASSRNVVALRKDGSEFPVEVSLGAWRSEKNTFFTAIIRDVSERSRTQSRLMQSEAKYRTLVERIPAITYTASLKETSQILFVSPQVESILGCPPSEYREAFNIWDKHLHRDDRRRVLQELSRSYENGVPFTSEYRMVTGDKRVIWIRDEADYVRDEAGKPELLQGVMVDITEQKRLEEELLNIEDRERRQIGHDLHDGVGQLLTGVAFKSHLLEKRIQNTEHHELAEEITDLVDQAKEQVRSLSRGFAPEAVAGIGLVGCLEDLAVSTRQMFGIECHFRPEGPFHLLEPTAVTHLHRIAQEAVTNAIRHGKASVIHISLHLTDGRAQMLVDDNGVGFNKTGASQAGIGLKIMGYRARMTGATLDIGRSPVGGVRVACSMPAERVHTTPRGRTGAAGNL